jgi:hypothetical protein
MNHNEVLDLWNHLFAEFIDNIEESLRPFEGWEAIEGVEFYLSCEEKELLSKNNLDFSSPEGIGNAYDLRSQVQDLMSNDNWIY